MESISIIDGKHQSLSKNALPDILSTALGVTFDTNVGHDYIDDAEKRYEYYHTVEDKIPFDLDYFNQSHGKINIKLIYILVTCGIYHTAPSIQPAINSFQRYTPINVNINTNSFIVFI